MIISVDTEKYFYKIQFPCMIKNSIEKRHKENGPQHNIAHV